MMFANGLIVFVKRSLTKPFSQWYHRQTTKYGGKPWRVAILCFSSILLFACGGGSSSSANMQDIENTLACSATEGATFTNNCTFNVFVEVLEGDNDDAGIDFFVPTQSSIVLPVEGEFTFGVCPEPSRPMQQGTGFVCS